MSEHSFLPSPPPPRPAISCFSAQQWTFLTVTDETNNLRRETLQTGMMILFLIWQRLKETQCLFNTVFVHAMNIQ